MQEHCGVTAVELIPDLESPQLVEALRHAEKRLQNRWYIKNISIISFFFICVSVTQKMARILYSSLLPFLSQP